MFDKRRIANLSFLIIDDNQMMVRIIRTLLHGLGVHDVYDASDAAAGFEELRNSDIDIILLDNLMDTIGGIEFARMIRNAPDSPNPQIPIIMISAYAEKAHILQARDVGVNEYICKPISANTLKQRILGVTERPRAFIISPKYVGPDRRRQKQSPYKGVERRNQMQNLDNSEAKPQTKALDHNLI